MPDPTKPPEVTSHTTTQEEEINRLRAQVRELQSELARRPASSARRSEIDDDDDELSNQRGNDRERRSDIGRRTSEAVDETAEVMRDLPARAMDEASKLLRGFTFAYLEQLRLASNVIRDFTEEVYQRNRPDTGREDRLRRGSERRGVEKFEEEADNRGRFARRSSERSRNDREFDEMEDEPWRRPEPRSSSTSRPRSSARAEGEERDVGRTRRGDRSTVTGLTGNLPLDIYSGFIRAVDDSLQVPSRVVDRFYDSFKQTEEAEPTRSEGRREMGRSRRQREDEIDEREEFDEGQDSEERQEARSRREFKRAQREAGRAAREATRAALESAKPTS